MGIFHSLLRGERTAEQTARQLGVPAERLVIYQDAVFGHVAGVLAKNFDALHRVLPSNVWDELVLRYFRRYPPANYELNADAASFVDLLAELAAIERSGISTVHVEIAQLEWQEFVAYVDPAEIPKPEAVDRLTLNPTLGVLQLSYPVAQLVDDLRTLASDDPAPPLPVARDPQQVVIFRDPLSELAVFYEADDALLFVIKMAYEGTSVEEAARLASVPADRVVELVDQAVVLGLVIAPYPRG